MPRTTSPPQPLQLDVRDERQGNVIARVSALALEPAQAVAALVLAHGAGAGMTHPFMQSLAEALAADGVASLRYQFPSMEAGARRPDPPALCQRTVHSAVALAASRWPTLPLFAGGKSFGGRMTSLAQAAGTLPTLHGLVFFGFPLHPAGRPSTNRAEHLLDVTCSCPLLFLQGSRDKLADLALLRPIVERLRNATLAVVADADHAFHVPVKSGRTDADVLGALARSTGAWMQRVAARASGNEPLKPGAQRTMRSKARVRWTTVPSGQGPKARQQ